MTRPVRILQFGEGVFLRAFLEPMVEILNRKAGFDAGVMIVRPRGGTPSPVADALNRDGAAYHVALRGVLDGRPVDRIERVTCVCGCLDPTVDSDWRRALEIATQPELRFVVSNTTEAGIVYRAGENTFPAKLAAVLAARRAAGRDGVVVVPCELIEHNGRTLRECVLRYTPDAATRDWISRECTFVDTLVDQIVSGAPPPASAAEFATRLGECDPALVCAEPFRLFVLERPVGQRHGEEWPEEVAGLPVRIVPDLAPYRLLKVRLLNGAHTATALAGILAGHTYVHELMADASFREYIDALYEEILPTIPLPDAVKRAYAASVLERLSNPHLNHRLRSIALNSVSKWRTRLLPSLLDARTRTGTTPPMLWKSLESLVAYYRAGLGDDSPEVLRFFATQPTTEEILANDSLWGIDLTPMKSPMKE